MTGNKMQLLLRENLVEGQLYFLRMYQSYCSLRSQ